MAGSKPATYPPAPGTADADNDPADSAAEVRGFKTSHSARRVRGRKRRPFRHVVPVGRISRRRGQPAEGPAKRGRPSECEPYRAMILAKLEQGSPPSGSTRTWSRARLRGQLRQRAAVRAAAGPTAAPLPFRRMECAAGEEAQVDFGTGAPIVGAGRQAAQDARLSDRAEPLAARPTARRRSGRRPRTSCAVWRTPSAHFGGVPKTLVIDNLKAAVKHPDWFDPELNPKVQSFCQHYGTVILPTKPYMPRHKGKVEAGRGVRAGQRPEGPEFASLEEQNQHPAHWEANVADTRIHGTTRQQVGKVFREVEQPALAAAAAGAVPLLPRGASGWSTATATSRWPRRTTRCRRSTWAARSGCAGTRGWCGSSISASSRSPCTCGTSRAGSARTAEHIAPEKISGVERGAAWLLEQGPRHRPADATTGPRRCCTPAASKALRVLQGLLSLTQAASLRSARKSLRNRPLATARSACARSAQLLERQAGQADSRCRSSTSIRSFAPWPTTPASSPRRLAPQERSSDGFERHDWTKESPAGATKRPRRNVVPRATAVRPPRSGYPSPGCSSAEPDSVSPDSSSVVPVPFTL